MTGMWQGIRLRRGSNDRRDWKFGACDLAPQRHVAGAAAIASFASLLGLAARLGLLLLAFSGDLFADEPRVRTTRPRPPERRPREVEEDPQIPGSDADVVEGETREFRVSVDGKERGRCTMRIDELQSGHVRLRVNSQIRVNYFVSEYRYASSATEIWNDGRLAELEATSDYNGTRYAVRVEPGSRGLHVTVNGRSPQRVDSDVWVTSYWHLPERLERAEAEHRGRVVPSGGPAQTKPKPRMIPLLDSDQGRPLRGELRYVGEDLIDVAGKQKPARHYLVTGDVKADLWYDALSRLVRQESVDQGHETTLELIRVTEHSGSSVTEPSGSSVKDRPLKRYKPQSN